MRTNWRKVIAAAWLVLFLSGVTGLALWRLYLVGGWLLCGGFLGALALIIALAYVTAWAILELADK